jgi:peroxiredoxin
MQKHKTKFIIGGALVIAAGLVWVGGGENRQLNAVSPLGERNNVAAPALSSDAAPNFSVTSLSGTPIALADFKGEKPVILDFFATWCPNCRRDMPKLSTWYEQYKDQVEVIGVNLQERDAVVRRYIEEAGISFPIVLDPRAETARAYGVQYTNYHVLIDREGNIAGFVPGDISEAHILSLINET